MEVTVRPATEHDVDFLTDVVVEATYDQGRFPDDFDEVDFRSGFGGWTAEQVRGELDGSSTSVVEVDGVRAGRLRVVRRRDLMEIAGLQLLPEHQSRGVGRTVVEGNGAGSPTSARTRVSTGCATRRADAGRQPDRPRA